MSTQLNNISLIERSYLQHQEREAYKESCFFIMPDSVIRHIFHFLANRDIAIASMVCKNWKSIIIKDNILKMKKINLDNYYGKDKWQKYFGDIGVEPTLPANIAQILNSPCPFFSEKKVRDTHILVLVPEKVNEREVHLDSLSELIKNPKRGYKMQYSWYYDFVRKELGTQSQKSHWVLITKDLIPYARYRHYLPKKPIQLFSEITIPYNRPRTLEAIISILMHYVETGEVLYTDDKLGKETKSICCPEKVYDNAWPVIIRADSSGNLYVYHYRDADDFESCFRGSWLCRYV
jgi:hypothetical protein